MFESDEYSVLSVMCVEYSVMCVSVMCVECDV